MTAGYEKIIDELIEVVVNEGASDLHLSEDPKTPKPQNPKTPYLRVLD